MNGTLTAMVFPETHTYRWYFLVMNPCQRYFGLSYKEIKPDKIYLSIYLYLYTYTNWVLFTSFHVNWRNLTVDLINFIIMAVHTKSNVVG